MILGEWAIKLTTNAGGLVSGLAEAGNRVSNFTSLVKSAASVIGAGLNSAINNITGINLGKETAELGKLASSFGGVFTAMMAGGPVAIIGAVAGVGAQMVSMASDGMQAIATQARLGRQLGITATEAGGLGIVLQRAGLSQEDFSGAMARMPHLMNELRQQMSHGGGPMTDALQALGVNAERFASVNSVERMAMLAEATAGMSEIQRGMSIDAIFGPRVGATLAPMIRRSADELRNMTGIAGEFGVTVDDGTASMINNVLKRLKDIGMYVNSMFSMLGRGMGVAFAPVALFVGDTVGGLVRSVRPLIEWIGVGLVGAFSGILLPVMLVVGAVRLFTPVVAVVSQMFGILKDNVVQTGMAVWQAFQPVIAVFGELFGSFSGLNPFDMWKDDCVLVAQFIGMAIRSVGLIIIGVVDTIIGSFRRMATVTLAAASILPISDAQQASLQNFADNLTNAQTAMATAQQSLQNFDPNAIGGAATPQTPQAPLSPNLPRILEINRGITDAIDKARESEGYLNAARADGSNVSRDILNRQLEIVRNMGLANATQDQINAALERQATLEGLNLAREVTDRTEAIVRESATIGMTARQTEIYGLRQRGVTEELIRQREAALDVQSLAQSRIEVENQVGQMIERNQTTYERFQNRWNELQIASQSAGGEGLDPIQRAREVGSMFEGLERGLSHTIHEAPSVLSQGTQEAARRVAEARRDAIGRSQDPAERAVAVLEQLRDMERRNQIRNERMLELMDNGLIGVAG